MKVLMTGGSGFIGSHLAQRLIEAGHEVAIFSRRPPDQVRKQVHRDCIPFNRLDPLALPFEPEVVFNLAGEPIADRRWSEARKAALLDSRIGVTNTLIELLTTLRQPPAVLISGSATGFYGAQGAVPVPETRAPHPEFTNTLCRQWEAAARKVKALGTRCVISRTGVVLGPGGFLARLRWPFLLGLGGRLGNGQQYLPWIHREDLVALLIRMMNDTSMKGPWNAVAPNPVTNAEFTAALARQLHRPAFFAVPAPLLRYGLGEMSRLLLTGQRALPDRLQRETDFTFLFPDLQSALASAMHEF